MAENDIYHLSFRGAGIQARLGGLFVGASPELAVKVSVWDPRHLKLHWGLPACSAHQKAGWLLARGCPSSLPRGPEPNTTAASLEYASWEHSREKPCRTDVGLETSTRK